MFSNRPLLDTGAKGGDVGVGQENVGNREATAAQGADGGRRFGHEVFRGHSDTGGLALVQYQEGMYVHTDIRCT